MVFCHSDLLATNYLDNESRLWIIDWNYAGFNFLLFALANLASNNQFADDTVWRFYLAMKFAFLPSVMMWSMISEIHIRLDFDCARFITEFLHPFEHANETFRNYF